MTTRPWVIVEHCGCDNEKVVREFDTYDDADADTAYFECYGDIEREQLGVSIMRRNPDGSLTTEY